MSPRVQLRAEPRVSQRSDPAEREAEDTAKRIMRMEAPATAPVGPRAAHLARFADAAGLIQRRGRGEPALARVAAAPGPATAPSGFAAAVANSRGGGSPLPTGVRGPMEARFGADFSRVRVHTGETAARLTSQVSAQAFTYGGDIFFGRDRYRPETDEGRGLIAHELTHTIQQGGATQERPVQRSEAPQISERSGPEVQRLGIADALDFFARQANNIPSFRMLTIVLGVNPINMRAVDRSAANILRALVEFIPSGALIVRALDTYGVFDRAGAWVEGQLRSLNITSASIKQAIDAFLAGLKWKDLLDFDLDGIWNRAKAIVGQPASRIAAFVFSLPSVIIDMVKDAILRPLATLAAQTPGWDLLCAVLGRNPITGDPVPRTADTLIGGFMKLIGQEEIWQNIKKANAISRAFAWFESALSGLLGLVQQLPGLFLQAFKALQISDLLELPTALGRVARVFGDFFGQFMSWAGGTIWDLLQIIFEVVAPAVMPYLRKAAGAFRTILRNPGAFVGNLVRAGKLGLTQFAANFVTHLKSSLVAWLTGAIAGAGVYIPQAVSLVEIGKFVLSVLGITWAKIRGKIVKVIGEKAMAAVELGVEVIVALKNGGLAAVWELIKEKLANLRDTVLQSIIGFVQERVVNAAISKLAMMLTPAGAFLQAIVAIYNTVMFFVERLRQIAQVAAAFIDGIAAIANGNIGPAASRVERVMAGLLTLVISFLARLAGLGKVTDAVVGLVKAVQAKVDAAIDAAIERIVAMARRLGRFIAQAGVPQDPAERLRLAERDAVAIARRLTGVATRALLDPALAVLRVRYGLQSIEPFEQEGSWWVRLQINPKGQKNLGIPAATADSPPLTPNLPWLMFNEARDRLNAMKPSERLAQFEKFREQILAAKQSIKIKEDDVKKVTAWTIEKQEVEGSDAILFLGSLGEPLVFTSGGEMLRGLGREIATMKVSSGRYKLDLGKRGGCYEYFWEWRGKALPPEHIIARMSEKERSTLKVRQALTSPPVATHPEPAPGGSRGAGQRYSSFDEILKQVSKPITTMDDIRNRMEKEEMEKLTSPPVATHPEPAPGGSRGAGQRYPSFDEILKQVSKPITTMDDIRNRMEKEKMDKKGKK